VATSTTVKRVKDPEEMIGAARRLIRAIEKRAENEDPWMAADMLGLSRDLEEATVRVVASLRARGYTWHDIGLSFGISGTTAVKRWAARVAQINDAQEAVAA
jgi:hypothetical protein